MSDVYVTYQFHRAAHADMVDRMWNVQWRNSLGDMVGRDMPSYEEAVAFAVARITNFGFVVVKDDEGQTTTIEVRFGEIYEEVEEPEDNQRQYENMHQAERDGFV